MAQGLKLGQVRGQLLNFVSGTPIESSINQGIGASSRLGLKFVDPLKGIISKYNASVGGAFGIGKGLVNTIVGGASFGNLYGPLNTSGGFRSFGWINGDGEALANRYKISIFIGDKFRVIGLMQDKTSIRISSTWESPSINIDSNVELGVQALGSFLNRPISLNTQVMSRRVWRGNSPVEMTLELNFEGLSDSVTEVMMPCALLCKLISPGADNDATVADKSVRLPFLSPPGPSPFNPNGGENVTIWIGSYLKFVNVIVKDINTEFDSRIGVDGNPVGAKATVTFQTYEILTKESIDNVFAVNQPIVL